MIQEVKFLHEKEKIPLLFSVRHQLGIVALELGDFESSQRIHKEILQVKTEYGFHCEKAPSYHQLGRVLELTG